MSSKKPVFHSFIFGKRPFMSLGLMALLSFSLGTPAVNALSVSRDAVPQDGSRAEVYMDSRNVSTADDLAAYARGALLSDDNLESLSFNKDAVEVSYKEEGKFLALVPVPMSLSARAYPDGTVEVRYPWYSFLTVTKREKMESEMKVAVDSALRFRLVGSVQAAGTSREPAFGIAESAQVAHALEQVLKENLGAGATSSEGIETGT
jgi:hypothetical protein